MIKLTYLFKAYPGSTQSAIRDLSLDIDHGEFCTFAGSNGYGKTTILRMTNQLDIPDSGDVYIQGVRLADADIIQIRCQIGLVMQNAALFSHRTVAQNIVTVPRLAGWSKVRVRTRIGELVALTSLNSHLLHRYSYQLSGGQRGHVAIARAIAANPSILLMDESFAAIDLVVRECPQDEFLFLQQRLQKTIVLVTHDINEAIRFGNKIAIFQEGGVLAQFGTSDRIPTHPASEFVRRLIGPEPNLKRLGMIQIGQLPCHDVPLLDKALTPIASTHPPPANPLRLVLDRQRRPLHWFSPQWGLTLPVERPLASSHSLRLAYSVLFDVATGVLVHVDDEGQYQGVASHTLLQQMLGDTVGVRFHDRLGLGYR